MALAAGAGQMGLPVAVKNVSFERPLFLPEAGEVSVHTALTPQTGGQTAFKIFSRPGSERSDDLWVQHASGTIARAEPLGTAASLEALRSICGESLHVESFYRELAVRGLQFGPAFQGIRSLWRGDGQALGRICLPPELVPASGSCCLHPALLDACSQVVAAALARLCPPGICTCWSESINSSARSQPGRKPGVMQCPRQSIRRMRSSTGPT